MRPLVADHPDNASYRFTWFRVLQTQGWLLIAHGDTDGGIDSQKLAFEVIRDLAGELPDTPAYQEAASMQALNVGNSMRDHGRRAEAEQFYRNALESIEPLIAEHPDRMEYQRNRALAYGGLGDVALMGNQRDEAEKWWASAVPIHRELEAAFAIVRSYSYELADRQSRVGAARLAWGQAEAAIGPLQEALQINRRQQKEHPDETSPNHALVQLVSRLGRAYFRAKQPEQAFACFEELRTLLEGLMVKTSSAPIYAFWAAGFYYGCPDPRFHDPARAITCATKAVELQADRPDYALALGCAHYRANHWHECLRLLKDVTNHPSPNMMSFWYFLAMAQWQSGHKAEAEKTVQEAERLLREAGWIHEGVPEVREEARALLAGDSPSRAP
jgi:tetratricopeptide (TPR) repeat protein